MRQFRRRFGQSRAVTSRIGALVAAALGAGSLTTAYWWAAGLLAGGALVTGLLFRSDTRPEVAHGPAEAIPA